MTVGGLGLPLFFPFELASDVRASWHCQVALDKVCACTALFQRLHLLVDAMPTNARNPPSGRFSRGRRSQNMSANQYTPRAQQSGSAARRRSAASRLPAEFDEEAAQEKHFRAHFELHAAQWAPQSLAALQAGAERAAAARAAAASRDQVSSPDDYAYMSDSD